MRRLMWNSLKFIIVFSVLTFFFYTGITYFHAEYQYQRMYEEPEGRVEKMFQQVDSVFEQMQVFLRLGE